MLTLNASGPRRVLQGWPSRREALVAGLKAEKADVAAFQQLWRADDVEALGEASGHATRAADPALGLAVTSRLPLVERSSRDLGFGGGVLRVRLTADGKEVGRATGSVILGNPFEALVLLANNPPPWRTLSAGHVVTTGSCTVPYDFDRPTAFVADFGPHGTVSATFA